MMRRGILWSLLLAVMFAPGAFGQTGELVDPDSLHPSPSVEYYRGHTAAVAVAPDNDFVVVYRRVTQTSDPDPIMFRLYRSPAGVGPEEVFNDNSPETVGGYHLADPDVGMADDGRFVVTWLRTASLDGGSDIHARRFGSDGKPLDAQFQVNTYTTGDQSPPSIAVDSDGNFVIVWEDKADGGKVKGHRYTSGGETSGGGAPQATFEMSGARPRVDSASDGRFVVTWVAGDDVKLQRYSSDGSAVNSPVDVALDYGDEKNWPDVAMSDSGEIIVAFLVAGVGAQGPAYSDDILAQRLSFDLGTETSTPIKVNVTSTAGDTARPKIDMSDDGTFAITWHEPKTAMEYEKIRVHMSNSRSCYSPFSGGPVEDFILVDANADGYQKFPQIGIVNGDYFVAVWDGPRGDLGDINANWAYKEDGDASVYYSSVPGGLIFADCFEGGDLSRWSEVCIGCF